MKRDFRNARAKSITPYTYGEQPKDKRYIKLNTNENPYPPSPAAVKALEDFRAEALRLYPDPSADLLRDAIARAEGVSRENIFCGNGSDEVLSLAFQAFFDGDRAACYPDITYSFYDVFAKLQGVNALHVPLKEDFSIDLAAMKNTDCGGYVIANPNAPTGVGISRAEMEAFVAAVGDKLVVVDEAYMDFFGESMAPLTETYENLLVVKTFSKSYSLAGIRCGYAVGNESLVQALFQMKDCTNSYPVDSVCAAVCVAAVGDREYHDTCVARVKAERERVREALLNLGFTVPKSEANFLFAGRAKRAGGEIYLALKDEGVLVRHFANPAISDFCRITIGRVEDNDVLLQKLKNILT